jgi:hypothetical protein
LLYANIYFCVVQDNVPGRLCLSCTHTARAWKFYLCSHTCSSDIVCISIHIVSVDTVTHVRRCHSRYTITLSYYRKRIFI